jgi:hypothetical protein
VIGLFPPHDLAWKADPETAVTPQAMEKVCREAAEKQFDVAARNINADWHSSYDGKQIQRWSERVGQNIAELQQQETACYRSTKQAKRPSGPPNDPDLLVIGMDGGRVQTNSKDKEGSRWAEDKVATISSCVRVKAETPDDQPEVKRLVTTSVATMDNSNRFQWLARVEAERRGIRQATEVIVIGDGAAFIDTIAEKQFPSCPRILDYYHATERLWECSRSLYREGPKYQRLGKKLEAHLWNGRVELVLRWLSMQCKKLGLPRKTDRTDHPRRVLAENLTYFTRHKDGMDYPTYRRRGWPLGSGVTESGVKQMNKRVKGTEQFWTKPGASAILALRALYRSEDNRWDHYWLCGTLLRSAA